MREPRQRSYQTAYELWLAQREMEPRKKPVLSMSQREVIWKKDPPLVKPDGLTPDQRDRLAELKDAQAAYLAALDRLCRKGETLTTAKSEFERAAMWATAALLG